MLNSLSCDFSARQADDIRTHSINGIHRVLDEFCRAWINADLNADRVERCGNLLGDCRLQGYGRAELCAAVEPTSNCCNACVLISMRGGEVPEGMESVIDP